MTDEPRGVIFSDRAALERLSSPLCRDRRLCSALKHHRAIAIMRARRLRQMERAA